MLVNDFVQVHNKNTINPVYYYRKMLREIPEPQLGDHHVPMKNIKYYMGVKDGKLHVKPLSEFQDSTMTVIPVWNKTGLVTKYNNKPYKEFGVNPEDLPTYEDNAGNVYAAGFSKDTGNEKSLLVAPNGKSLFLKSPYVGKFSKEQTDMINNFLTKNGGAYPVLVDNGSYGKFYENNDSLTTKGLYDKYVSGDFYRDPNDVFIIGEVAK